MAFSKNVPKSESEKKDVGSNEFTEERNRSSGEWKSSDGGLGNTVGDYYLDGNRELEEKQVTNAIGGDQLANLQFELSRGNGKYSTERSQKIIAQEMHAMRIGIPKGGLITYAATKAV